MNKVTNWIKSHQVAAFFIITFAITWGLGFSYGAFYKGQFLMAPLAFLATCGGLRLDLDQHTLTVDSTPVELTRTEFNLLEALLSNPGYTLTRDELLEKAVGYAYEGLGRALDTHIRNLRRKIEPDPDNPTYIQTVYGVGYRLAGEK